MKPALLIALLIPLLAFVLPGCGRKDHHASGGGDGHSHNADGSHSDSAQSFSGATHKEGTGITLLDETRKLLGIRTAEVQEQTLPREIRFTARVYGPGTDTPARGGAVVSQLGLGTVSTTNVALLRAGLPVHFRADSGVTTTGLVQQVSKPLANHEAEVIMTFAPATTTLQQGDFGQVTISVPGEKPALVVPRESVIRGTSGNLVYAVNGDAYILTWVEVGVESDGFVEITDGLLAGDSVVTSGAMDLWLVELRAVKGGQGCCPAPPKKGKN